MHVGERTMIISNNLAGTTSDT